MALAHRVALALAAALAVAAPAVAQADDPFELGSDEFGPDFESDPELPEGDDVLLVSDDAEALQQSVSEYFGDPALTEPDEEPQADAEESAPTPAPSSGSTKKGVPAPGVLGALAAIAAVGALARRRGLS